jgi:hypothetical protein
MSRPPTPVPVAHERVHSSPEAEVAASRALPEVGQRVHISRRKAVIADGVERFKAHADAACFKLWSETIPWAANAPPPKAWGNLVTVVPSRAAPPADASSGAAGGGDVGIVALDNRGGLVAVDLGAVQLATYVGMDGVVEPIDSDVMTQWRSAARLAFNGRRGYVPVEDLTGEPARVLEIVPHPKFAGQFVTVLRLDDQDPRLYRVDAGKINCNSSSRNDLVHEDYTKRGDSAESVDFFTLCHGFEVQLRSSGDKPFDGPRRKQATALDAEAAKRSGVNVDTYDLQVEEETTRPQDEFIDVDMATPPLEAEVANGLASEDGEEAEEPLLLTEPIYVARGYGAEVFNELTKEDPNCYLSILAKPNPPPVGQLWQSRIIRPDFDVILGPSLAALGASFDPN